MKNIKLIALMLLAILLTGCAASGPKHADIKGSLPTVAQGKGRIYFYRENSMVGAAIQPEIKLNGVAVGKSVPGGFFFVDQAGGQYSVTTSTEVEKSTKFALTAGQTRYIQTSISMGLFVGHVTPRLIDQEQAEKDLQNLSYTGEALNAKPAATDKGQQAAAMSDNKGGDVTQIQTIEFRPGVSSATVERIAQHHGCNSGKGAALITERGPVEIYRMTCDDGTTFLARCELRQCQAMR